MRDLLNFNPHSHEGSDDATPIPLSAPVSDFNPHSHEGSDYHNFEYGLMRLYFNPHSHEGSDFSQCFYQCLIIVYFNPHSHEGSDWNPEAFGALSIDFNPHSHEGSDIVCKFMFDIFYIISIHTPMKGVTNQYFINAFKINISIHTPMKGVTKAGWMTKGFKLFQSTLP